MQAVVVVSAGILRYAREDGWNVYRDGHLLHFPGPNPGTPYTECGLDAGTMVREVHPPMNAAIWCTRCMEVMSSRHETTPPAELPEAQYMGFYSRFFCPNCNEDFEIEGDVTSGETVRCDACGKDSQVVGR